MIQSSIGREHSHTTGQSASLGDQAKAVDTRDRKKRFFSSQFYHLHTRQEVLFLNASCHHFSQRFLLLPFFTTLILDVARRFFKMLYLFSKGTRGIADATDRGSYRVRRNEYQIDAMSQKS